MEKKYTIDTSCFNLWYKDSQLNYFFEYFQPGARGKVFYNQKLPFPLSRFYLLGWRNDDEQRPIYDLVTLLEIVDGDTETGSGGLALRSLPTQRGDIQKALTDAGLTVELTGTSMIVANGATQLVLEFGFILEPAYQAFGVPSLRTFFYTSMAYRRQDGYDADHGDQDHLLLDPVTFDAANFMEQLETYLILVSEMYAALCKAADTSMPMVELGHLDFEPAPKEDISEVFGALSDMPSATQKFVVEKPSGVGFADIGGQAEAKRELQSVVQAIRKPELYQRWGTRPPRGVLLYGEPGTGKTMLAKALAAEAEATFLHIRATDIGSKWYGESEKLLQEAFDIAKTEPGKTILFFDEVDALAQSRGGSDNEASQRIVATMLENIDGLQSDNDLLILASTNRKDVIDDALLRPGRLDRHVYVALPETEDRVAILELTMRKAEEIAGRKLFAHIDAHTIAEAMQGYSGADITEMIRRTLEEKVRQEGEGDHEPLKVAQGEIIYQIEHYERNLRKQKAFMGFQNAETQK